MSATEEIHFPLPRTNSNDDADEYVLVSSSSASTVILTNNSPDQNFTEEDNDDYLDYYTEFSWPDDEDGLEYYTDNDDENYLNDHLTDQQLSFVDQLEETKYQRSKRSNKKIKAQRQIKTKHAKSIKHNSHNQSLYIHHRILKRVILDAPSQNYLSSPPRVPLHSPEALRSNIHEHRHGRTTWTAPKTSQPAARQPEPSHQFREYTINEHNIPNEPAFDDAMISFLLEMQNRDLSPEDYEMLLRLDERVQRRTVDKNILDTLPTVNVTESHLHDQCTICMESYLLGQQLKLLPCTHLFHLTCIETYLRDFSTQCPLDNLPLT